jgi:undecaprenyl diphosphate synthase
LLWQLAYTELYFSEAFWPDFDGSVLNHAIASYRSRERRFGRTSEQVRHGLEHPPISAARPADADPTEPFAGRVDLEI